MSPTVCSSVSPVTAAASSAVGARPTKWRNQPSAPGFPPSALRKDDKSTRAPAWLPAASANPKFHRHISDPIHGSSSSG